MPVALTILIARLAGWLSRITGRGGGSALPGLIAQKLDSQIVAKLIKSLKGNVILISGTNGKTTTAKMLVAALEQTGQTVLANPSGSNLYRGVAAATIAKSSWLGRIKADLAVFEVDEASLPLVEAQTRPKAIVILNLFRDQLDRYGELDSTAKLIGNCLKQSAADVYLNADDPLVTSLKEYPPDSARVHFFGVEETPVRRLKHDLAADSNHCPNDGQALKYSRNFFGHIGHYECPAGDFGRPQPEAGMIQSGQANTVEVGGKKYQLNLQLPGLYNAYNALAAMTVAFGRGIDPKTAAEAINAVAAAFGRVERIKIQNRELYLLLIKNPTGFNQVIQTFLTESPGNLLIAVNDNFADGRDVSWLWDVGFEEIRTELPIFATGIRAADLALRLKYGGMALIVEPDLNRSLKRLIARTPSGQSAYILPTYTAMLELRQILKLRRFEA